MKLSKIIGFMLVYITITLTACTEDVTNIFGGGHEIAFEVKTDSVGITRASESVTEIEPQLCITAEGDTFYLHTDIMPMPDVIQTADSAFTRGATADATSLQGGFGVSAYNTDGSTQGDAYFLNSGTSCTTVSSVDYYTPSGAGKKKYWPTGKLNFYAYYPYVSSIGAAADAHGLSLQSNAYRISYTVPSSPANHPDLMTAKLTNQQYVANETESGVRALSFNHALCAIRFQTGSTIAGGTINSISFNGIYGSGTYDISAQDWITRTKASSAVSFTGLSKGTTEGTAGTAILTGDNTLMLIPQDFTSDPDASITINFTPTGSTARNLTCSLTDTKWEAGKCITYTITTDGLVWAYVLTATGGSTTYAGGNVSYSVTSYRYKRTNTSVKEAIDWQIDGYKENGASDYSASAPSWLTVGSGQGVGSGSSSATAESKSVTVGAQSPTTTGATFTSTERGTQSDPYDLSTHSFAGTERTRSTSNCYAIQAPGWYKLPLVYGNGISGGSNNSAAYTSSSSTFVDYNGTYIKNFDTSYSYKAGPYIKNSGTPASAIIIWQDIEDLIQDLSYDSSGDGYLKFHIGSNMGEGNAVIAVRDNTGVVMWSWHIWVTSVNLNSTVQITAANTSYKYNFMPVWIGYVGTATTTTYAARNTTLRIKNSNGNTATCVISQTEKTSSSTANNAPYFQFGRKDPFIPWSGLIVNGTYTDKAVWGTYNTYQSTNGISTIKDCIRTPQMYYYRYPYVDANSYLWQSTPLFDLWNAGKNSSYYHNNGSSNYAAVTKTIYDPSPVGFKLPPGYAYSGMIYKSNTAQSYTLYTNSSKNATISLPIVGHRHYQDGLVYASCTYFWTALPYHSNGSGAIYNCFYDGVYRSTPASAAANYGFVILPTTDE